MNDKVIDKLLDIGDKLEDRRYRILVEYSIDGLKDEEFLESIEKIEKEQKLISDILAKSNDNERPKKNNL